MPDKAPAPEIKAVLALLGEEVRRPIDALQGEIDRILLDPAQPISEAQRSHTQTMQAVCEEIRKLTDECLGGPADGEAGGDAGPARGPSA